MATANMKGYFKQQKKSKPNLKTKPHSIPKKSPIQFATLGSEVAQPRALISHASPDLTGDYDEQENVLRQFDLDMAYGPCVGMNRLARWERAYRLGMNPPKDVEGLLKNTKVGLECLWNTRV